MSVKVPFECPGCHHPGQVKVSSLGMSATCRHCGCRLQLPRHLRLSCPNCREVLRVSPTYLDQNVNCKFCRESFTASIDRALFLTQATVLPPLGTNTAADAIPFSALADPLVQKLDSQIEVLRGEIGAIARELAESESFREAELESLRAECQAQAEGRRAAEAEVAHLREVLEACEHELEQAREQLAALQDRDEIDEPSAALSLDRRDELLTEPEAISAPADQREARVATILHSASWLAVELATVPRFPENDPERPTEFIELPSTEVAALTSSDELDATTTGWEPDSSEQADPNAPAEAEDAVEEGVTQT